MTTPRRRLLRALRRPTDSAEDLVTGPIQGELLGAEHLAERARMVARSQVIAPPSPLHHRARLLARLDGTAQILSNAYTSISRNANHLGEPDPSAEWLLDNYHVVQDHMQEVRDSLPRGYYRELPELAEGPLTGYPRVYELAIALISHSEGRIDLDNVDLFVQAFQEVEPLSIGELWAIPAMLRLGLIENIRRMTLRTVQRLDELAEADRWAIKIQLAAERGGSGLGNSLRDVAAKRERLTPIFVARFLTQLRSAGGASPALVWLERWLSDEGLRPDDATARATQRVAHTQFMMANSITSLRTIGRRDWRGFTERQSAMEAVLQRDPAGFYPRMTFGTRDRYRHVVERLAKRSNQPETVVAGMAIELASNVVADHPLAVRRNHVGYFLVDEGLEELEAAVGSSPPTGERFFRMLRDHPDVVLVGGLATLTFLALIAVTILAGSRVAVVTWPLILLFTFLPAWDIGISTVNQLVTAILPPRVLPSLDLREAGVPPEFQTIVVVPTLFGNEGDVRSALDNIEVVYLANRDGAIQFAILSDFTDAATESTPTDAGLIAQAVEGIESLNQRYATGDAPSFYLFHRPRLWNEPQGSWIGWERKRGKLEQFNQLLITGDQSPFSIISSDPGPLASARYVITLDADTMLPQGAATALVGTMAHPLNRAVHDPSHNQVIAGYGILQPRVGVSLPSAQRSRFASIHAGQPGVDPYTTAVSDVYQDLYGEGSFTGKGIYDIRAFTAATRDRFPENTLLSHDLIEGNFARAGLSTGISVYDDYPVTYAAHARRKHRWIRGDWQLLPWLAPKVPGPSGKEPNHLSLLSRWKIIDNLRRSMVEIAQLALILAGWTILAGSPIRWTLLGLGAIAAPWAVSLLLAAIRPPADKSWRAYYRAIGRDAVSSAKQFALAVIFLPHQAWLSADAIGRTLIRLFVTRRKLLEWQPAAQVEQRIVGVRAAHWQAMRPAVLMMIALALVVTAVALRTPAEGMPEPSLWRVLVSVWPLTMLWIASPSIATWLSRETGDSEPLPAAAQATVRRYVEHHWRYFDRYITADTNWLVPDNVQFSPEEVVALRTSPTNIGLQLLTVVSAHDLGFIDLQSTATRIEQTLDTLDKLSRFRGHFFNWYAIDDLHVLEPAYVSTVDSGNLAGHLIALKQGCLALAAGSEVPADLRDQLVMIAARADQLVMEMDFAFLFDAPTRLFAIGYHPDSHTMDASFYDLLASEARLAAFVAIAKDDVPVEAWFRFGRALIRRDGVPMLVSWSGSMFEYLMPLLVMESFPGTLLDQSDRAAIAGQIAYGRERGVPWGVSESAYNYRDLQQTYQYRAFGVPDLALKRGLGRDLVIAPYASALAAMQSPKRALANLAALEKLGALGEFGFWDALDFTRPDPDARFAIVKTVMAHHAGMSVVAFTNLLHDNIWRQRFHDEAMVRAAELLLQERVPRRLQVQQSPGKKSDEAGRDATPEAPTVRRITAAESAQPRVALLGDLPYTVMVTHAGSGYSKYESMAVNRFRADGTTDDTGQFCYLRDLTTDRIWSAGHQPVGAEADQYHVYFAPDRATFHRIDGKIETRTEIVVVQGDCAEVRRITLTNHASEDRDIELTSYGEVVMAPLTTDAAHPAFSNLFVETEWHDWCSAVMARRRPRQTGEPAPWCVHVVDSGSHHVGAVSCETDRSRFIGRGRTTRRPAALDRAGPLSGEVGAVLDPIMALRTTVRVPSRESVTVSFTTLVATTRERAFELADRYHDQHASQRALDLAWMATQLDLREVGMNSNQAAVFQEIAGHLIYGRDAMRPPADELRRNQGSQARLWTHGISGDLPIVLALIDEVKGLATLRELFTAHRFWRRRGLSVDLVIIVSHPHDYLQELRHAITEVMFAASDATMVDQPGGVFIRRRDAFLPDDYLMLSATARVHIPCDGRPLARIVPATATRARAVADEVLQPRLLERRTRLALPAVTVPKGAPVTAARNGYGQLDDENNYAIEVTGDHVPPAPWSNVIANPHGGFLVSERGSGFIWAANSYFYRLTPWHNDPVSDPPSDVIYLRDAERGELWSATPASVPAVEGYHVNHGPGRSVFAHRHGDIESELTVGLPTDAAVKLSALKLTNHSRETRTITITAYAEWTLGVRRETTWSQVRTRLLPDTNAILAQNFFDAAFSDQVAFMATTEPITTYTADRREFLGRHGTLAAPVALSRDRMSAATGVGLDPCAALQFTVTLSPGETQEVAVLLGAATGEEQVRMLLARFNTAEAVRTAINDNVKAWDDRLSTITVRTPDPEFDALVNRWTLYQALSSRMWGRTGLYQSSGAYGFRDQLQDVMAFVYAEPAVAREHLLRAAARQFVEGDVQHWWHPHTGRGVRTRFSDDLAWLPFVVDHYITTTGDTAVLDEYVPFLTMRQLAPDEHEVYDLPRVADEHGSIYEHCLRALRRACTTGAHGLPLIGTGDWNDGFSRVGIEGKGESVWLAWFLIINCRNMAVYAESRGDTQVAIDLREQAEKYVAAVAEHGWDGNWYRRAYYDDGVPMGSAGDESCQIDSLAQSWSVISGAASMERQLQAMASLQEHLVDEDLRLIKLLTPAFDQDGRDPGYIKGYLPGVRENGAQYTHAALWAVQATAMLGEGDRAWELYRMINPLTHADTPEAVAIYKVEPYVVAADVYTAEGQLGRGGWTWYTGSASWMYRVGLESLLGFKLTGDTLEIIPCVPKAWPSFEIDYRYRTSTYRIMVVEPAAIRERGVKITVDGAETDEPVIRLVDDGAVHEVSIVAAPVIARPPYAA